MAMKVIGFAGYSGAGKTTLVEALMMLMRSAGSASRSSSMPTTI
jgi:molybdopterin-guanine dinucleotide biosynthesis protein